MEYRQLGNSDISISALSFGGMSLDYQNPNAISLLHKAIDYGVNFFDTSDLYDQGQNEILLGNALKAHRHKVSIATKVGNKWRSDGSGWDWNPRKNYILTAVHKSLQRLQTDYIDLYQLHGGTIDDPIDEIIDAFETLKKQGEIRYYGISSIRPNVIREYVEKSNITSVMMQYSLLDRRPEEKCLSLLQKNNIGVLARGTVAKGLLAGKSAKEYLSHSVSQVEKSVECLKTVTGASKTLSQTAMQYVLKHHGVSSAVMGLRTENQVIDSLHNFPEKELSQQEYEILQNSNNAYLYEHHR
ncbi:aldo/keto reductase [Aquimarina sp. D1M17]|uniref:aldo/keto reductase n=1 Tax=Aquimarina acroporae TaxID=2937283 RepID=UPI0020BEAB8E|nr:aldo/keto reductase [Aquimarina acroporae]MCK8523769.1 aldo/keto reductase [Aquimarina acroporae]